MANCAACSKPGHKTWQGDDPKCAFPNGASFSGENWNCGTMNALRDIAGEEGSEHYGCHYARVDDESIGVVPINDSVDFEPEEGRFFLVMTWYKSRGCTGTACLSLPSLAYGAWRGMS